MGERIEDPLYDPDGQYVASDMLEQREAPARTEDPLRLGHCARVVGHRAQRECGDHRIERVGGEIHRLTTGATWAIAGLTGRVAASFLLR